MKNLEKTTGYLRGGCSPIGMKKSFPTFMMILKEIRNIFFFAGARGSQ